MPLVRGVHAGRIPALARADLAEMQMRRETRGAVVIGAVALRGVIVDALVEEGVQAFECSRLARLPGVAKSFGPIGLLRKELPACERVGGEASLERHEAGW